MVDGFIPGYALRRGSGLDRALLVKFMQKTYQELYPDREFSHLALTVDHYYSPETPLWWVEAQESRQVSQPVACLWVGNSVDQATGDRHAHIFLLYVLPDHRRRGIGSQLMRHVEQWAAKRGDRQIGLQVFNCNQAALNLYTSRGYEPQSIWMVKQL
jgi:ribosomal protein S18 acetylase RimI-like enzyme